MILKSPTMTVVRGYAIFVEITYFSEDGLAKIQNALKGVQFEKP